MHVNLPKFKLQYRQELQEALTSMGKTTSLTKMIRTCFRTVVVLKVVFRDPQVGSLRGFQMDSCRLITQSVGPFGFIGPAL